MNRMVVTSIDAKVDPAREADLLAGYRLMNGAVKPAALLRSELLRGQDGHWRIQTTWRDIEALRAVRSSGGRPAAIDLLDSVGAEHSHTVLTVEQFYEA
jgi:hypothetical protein